MSVAAATFRGAAREHTFVVPGTDENVRITLSPIATPLPLTFCGLLIASVVVAGSELGWVPLSEHHTLGWILLAIPVPLQLLAAWWGFVARSATAATGSGILAAGWFATALDFIHSPPSSAPWHALGLTSVAVAAALLVPAVAEVRVGALLPGGVLLLAGVRFVLEGIAGLAHSETWADVSAIASLVVAASALYAALALELEGTTQRDGLPVFRRRGARVALEEPLEAQFDQLVHDAGVRRTL